MNDATPDDGQSSGLPPETSFLENELERDPKKFYPEKRDFNYSDHHPLLIDNKEIYYKGFLSLKDEDKARALLGMMMTLQTSPELYNLENLTPGTLREKHEIKQSNIKLKFKLYTTVVLIAVAVIILGVFTYMSLTKGVLDDNGALSGILSTIQEVLRIIFMETPSSSF